MASCREKLQSSPAARGNRVSYSSAFVKEGAYVFTRPPQKVLDEAVTAIGSNVTGVRGRRKTGGPGSSLRSSR